MPAWARRRACRHGWRSQNHIVMALDAWRALRPETGGMMTDQDLLRRIAAGDISAFTAFYDRYAPRVWGLVSRILPRREDAEDALQTTFWHVWRSAAQYDDTRACPEVWLLLLARCRALDHLRRQKPAAPLPEVDFPSRDELGSGLEGRPADRVRRPGAGRPPGKKKSRPSWRT